MGTRTIHVSQPLMLMLLVCAVSANATARQPVAARAAAGMVTHVQGTATAVDRSGARALRLFDRVAEGDTIRLRGDAEVVLVFRSGARVRMAGVGEARVRAGAVDAKAGFAESLAPLPTVPLVAPVAGAGTATAAVRVRAEGLRATVPAAGETIAGTAVTLAYEPAGAQSYDVEVTRPNATVAFRQLTSATTTVVPAEHLEPGTTYHWRVTARWPTGFAASADGMFRTLSADSAKERTALRAAVGEADAASRALLAEVDFTLGLWRAALAQFEAAAAGATDPVVSERIAKLRQLLAAAPPRDH